MVAIVYFRLTLKTRLNGFKTLKNSITVFTSFAPVVQSNKKTCRGVVMTNEQLAELIQDGQKEYIYPLWLNLRPLIMKLSNRCYTFYSTAFEKAGITLEDIEQEAFFALLEAVKAYRPKDGYKLSTYLTYQLKKTFNTLAGFRTVKRLNEAVSLEAPTGGGDGEPLTLGDTIEDKTALEDIQEAERALYNKQLRKDLKAAIERLSDAQKDIIEQRYYKRLTMADIARQRQTTPSKIVSINKKALYALSKDKVIRERYRQDIISAHAYRGSFTAWKYSGYSSVEKTVARLLEVQKREYNLII